VEATPSPAFTDQLPSSASRSSVFPPDKRSRPPPDLQPDSSLPTTKSAIGRRKKKQRRKEGPGADL